MATAIAVPSAPVLTEQFQDAITGMSQFFHTASASYYGGSASIDISSGPTIQAFSGTNSLASANLAFSFVINGPAQVGAVPLDITYSYAFVGNTDQSENLSLNPSGGSLRISYTGISPSNFFSVNTNSTDAVANGSVNTISATNALYQTSVPTGTKISITMNVGANGSGSSAFLDPFFAIDPSFFAANTQYSAADFQILESSGVANGVQDSSLPEPGSAPLLMTFLGLAFSARQTRRA